MRLRERRAFSWRVEPEGWPACECIGRFIELACGVGGNPVAVDCSFGKSSWVGESLFKLPFWLEVVMEREDVAVVVPCEGTSALTKMIC